MEYAEVAVDAPVAPSRTFSYHIPARFAVESGQLVWVPFGRRVAQGIVSKLSLSPQVEVTKDILQPVEPAPLLDWRALRIGEWMSRYYLCSLFDALALFLPPEFKGQVRAVVRPGLVRQSESSLGDSETEDVLAELAQRGQMPEAEFTKLFKRGGARQVDRWVERGVIQRQVTLPRPGRFRYECFLIPAGGLTSAGLMGEMDSGLPRRQERLVQAVAESQQPYPRTLANKEFGSGVAEALVEKGLLAQEWTRTERDLTPADGPNGGRPDFTLSAAQANAAERIAQGFTDTGRGTKTFLLHGVTGSGKTEVYLRAIEEAIQRGKQAIFLVPEISLTPQTVERVNQRFPGRVAVLHSGQKPREKFDQWWAIRDGKYDVVVGPRSALFAPLPNVGLIVIDEEHEWTYKQQDLQPRYHARTTALEMARLDKAVVVLGSATPDVETYYQASRGRHVLLHLPQRIGSGREGAIPAPLADAEICDMREELKQGNRSIFSRRLARGLAETVNRGQQAILFLNRRGSAPIVQCRDCGYVATCSRCSVSLTYHATDGRLSCHRCNRRAGMPKECRECRGSRIRQLGIGTQRVVDEVSQLLPGVRVERWDADVTRSGLTPEEPMGRLARGETQVLVGTQMVAKGLDVPSVTLVGVVLADVGMHLPDFRSGERTFGLLCQVAGRAGRGREPGWVVIQTYNPEHYAVQAAAAQDYLALYQQEIGARREQSNPPFNRLMHLVYQQTNRTACQRHAATLAREFRERRGRGGLSDVEVIGPAPGIPERVRGQYRWHILLRGRNLHRFLEGVTLDNGWSVDVDPVQVT